MRTGPDVARTAEVTGAAPASRSAPRALWFILAVAALARLPGLGGWPPPLNQDEASRGYDAWCLLESGQDRWGESWPLFQRSFGPGDYTAALSTWLMLPSVALVGPTPAAMRLPTALGGVLTVALLRIWVRRLWGDRVALAAALLLALSPWHISLTRTAHEAAWTPFFLCAGLLGWTLAGLPPFGNAVADSHSRNGIRRLMAAGLGGASLGLCAWVYPAPRLLIPVMLAALVLLFAGRWWRALREAAERRVIIGGLVGLVVGAAPLWLTLATQPEKLAARANSVLIWTAPIGVMDRLGWMFRNYAAEFSPITLFVRVSELGLGLTDYLNDYGRLLHVEAPLLLCGLCMLLLRARCGATDRGLLLLLLLHPLPAALCGDWNPNPLRSFAGVILWPVVGGLGAAAVWDGLSTRGGWRARVVPLLVAALAVDVGWCAYAFAVRMPVRTADFFQENLAVAARRAAALEQDFDAVILTDISNQPYLYTLLFRPMPPTEWRDARKVIVPWYSNFEHLLRLGKYLYPPFVEPRASMGREVLARFRSELAELPAGARVLIIDIPGRGPPGDLIETILRRNGEPGLELRAGVIERAPPPG